MLVLVMRFFKLKNQHKQNFHNKWKETFDCSIEIVYTSSGFVIALLLNVQNLIPVIIVGYVLVIISASYLERSAEDEFSPNAKFAMNMLIIAIVFLSTIFGYAELIPESTDINGHTTLVSNEIIHKEDSSIYTVILPYQDNTLNTHVGSKLLEGKSFYLSINVSDSTKEAAILKAISIFNDSLNPKPIFNSSNNKSISLDVDGIQCFKN
jgi:hypothetical protein